MKDRSNTLCYILNTIIIGLDRRSEPTCNTVLLNIAYNVGYLQSKNISHCK